MDTETFDTQSKKQTGDDLVSMSTDLIKGTNFKIAIFLFIFGILIFSDAFIDTILVNFKGTTSDDVPTTKGTVVQLLFLVFGYLIIDLLVQGQII